ncbi:MAG TPA: hypothetical protein VEI03_03575 [Stellaceae bacterium]|nr:hypothetical protein [Stellaceae bacterium]
MAVSERQPVVDPGGMARNNPAPKYRCRRSEGVGASIGSARFPPPNHRDAAPLVADERLSGRDEPDGVL